MLSTNFNEEEFGGAPACLHTLHEAQNETRIGTLRAGTHSFLRDTTNLEIYIQKIIVD